VVDEFLQGLPAGSVGLDVGCGNGKYLTVNKDVFIVASDRYVNLDCEEVRFD
jgi:tRNA (uracil-5-)-methyltransferase TRM9